MFELSEQKKALLETDGNLLIMGGPGSGKTTIALIKAKYILERKDLLTGQTILFLSFARATILRVQQHASVVIPPELKSRIDITTYHSFAWTLLRSHGYLLNNNALRLLPPHESASRLAVVDNKENEKWRLFNEEGLIHFDLFAKLCFCLINESQAIAKIIAAAYPVIILDEFQDTNSEEWEFIQELGKRSCLISLADPEQRIYDFRGASPARIRQFIEAFKPAVFDFGQENNRSAGTDIIKYGNDLLIGKNKSESYNDVQCYYYPPRKNNAQLISLKTYILNAYDRQKKAGRNNWSIAVLLPTNSLMITVSDFLDSRQQLSSGQVLPQIHHDLAVETAGPCIAGVLIAGLLDGGSQKKASKEDLIENLCSHILGRRGTKAPCKADIAFASCLTQYNKGTSVKGKTRQCVIDDCNCIIKKCNDASFTGDVAADWVMVRDIVASALSEYLIKVANDAKYLKLLRRGSILNAGLGQLWKRSHNYLGAKKVVQDALAQEHFSTSTQAWNGVSVMTIHKAKGKEFDEVIVYEGAFPGQRIVFDSKNVDQARINLRVAVTRAREKSIIITPKNDPCCLL